jgi:hypothetical protein
LPNNVDFVDSGQVEAPAIAAFEPGRSLVFIGWKPMPHNARDFRQSLSGL